MGIALLRGCRCHYTVVNIDREEYDNSKLMFWMDLELKQKCILNLAGWHNRLSVAIL